MYPTASSDFLPAYIGGINSLMAQERQQHDFAEDIANRILKEQQFKMQEERLKQSEDNSQKRFELQEKGIDQRAKTGQANTDRAAFHDAMTAMLGGIPPIVASAGLPPQYQEQVKQASMVGPQAAYAEDTKNYAANKTARAEGMSADQALQAVLGMVGGAPGVAAEPLRAQQPPIPAELPAPVAPTWESVGSQPFKTPKQALAEQAEQRKAQADAAKAQRETERLRIMEQGRQDRAQENSAKNDLRSEYQKFLKDQSERKNNLDKIDQELKRVDMQHKWGHWNKMDSRERSKANSMLSQLTGMEKSGLIARNRYDKEKREQEAKIATDEAMLKGYGLDPKAMPSSDAIEAAAKYNPQTYAEIHKAYGRIQSSQEYKKVWDEGIKAIDEDLASTRLKMQELGAGPTGKGGDVKSPPKGGTTTQSAEDRVRAKFGLK